MLPADRIIELTKLIDSRMAELEALKGKAQAENRHLNDEERKKYSEFMTDIATYSEELKLEKREMELRGDLSQVQRQAVLPGMDHLDERQIKYPGLAARGQRFESFGDQLQAVAKAAVPSQGVDRRLVEIRAAQGMSEGVPSDGGFVVQTDFQTEILNDVYKLGDILPLVRKIQISANMNSLTLNSIKESSRASTRWGGILGYWLAEAGTKQTSKPEFEQKTWKLKKVACLVYATDELLQDSTALEGVIRMGCAEEIAFQTQDKFIEGTGAGVPLGVLNSGCLVSVTKETGQLADTIVYENIVKMWARGKASGRKNMVWLINQEVEPQLFTMGLIIGTGGTPVYMPPGGASASPYSTLFGRPVIPVEQCSALGDQGDIILCDWSQYLAIDKGGIQGASSIHVSFIYDETCFRFVYRVDGQPLWSTALTPFKGTATLSPFVTLDARA